METYYLALSWSTSRGRDTYGYNICRLDAPGYFGPDKLFRGSKRYRCSGGGYDMVGTVVAEWLCDRYPDRLLTIAPCARAVYSKADGYTTQPGGRYGVCYLADETRVSIDGACGINSVCGIASAIGISLSSTCDRRGHTTGFMVTDYGSAEALKAAQS